MEKSKRGLSLIETLVAMCIATMLLIGLGTSFYMFRTVNTNTVKDSKKELNIMSIRDYITNNGDNIVSRRTGLYYLSADTDKVEQNDYALYLYDGKFYLISSVRPTYIGDQDWIKNLGKILVVDDDGEPVKTINEQTLVAFPMPEYREGLPFFLVDSEGNEILLHDIVEEKDERGIENLAPEQQIIGANLYYSDSYKRKDLFDNLFTYDPDTGELRIFRDAADITVNDNTGEETPGTLIFKNLPYDVLDISLSIDTDTFILQKLWKCDECGYEAHADVAPDICPRCAEEQGIEEFGNTDEFKESNFSLVSDAKTMPTYGIKAVSAAPDHGVAFVSTVDRVNNYAILEAKECVFVGQDLDEDGKMDEDDEEEIDEDDYIEVVRPKRKDPKEGDDILNPEDYEDLGKGTHFSYAFEGWYLNGDKVSDDYQLIVTDFPESGDVDKYKARFSEDLTECESLIENHIDEELKYTYVSKEVYTVKCKINYHKKPEKSDTENLPVQTTEFVVGIYYKYFPEIYNYE
ncbi:MAG: hypothetical protein KBT35_00990 [Firmicutes bacterium]|nr:hypothetical protein [Candidatus Colivicinus equi]